jgi:hypothetical protein
VVVGIEKDRGLIVTALLASRRHLGGREPSEFPCPVWANFMTVSGLVLTDSGRSTRRRSFRRVASMKKGGRHARGERVTPKGTPLPRTTGHVARSRPMQASETPLMIEVRGRLVTGDPLDLLAQASGLVAALYPRSRGPFDQVADRHKDLPSLGELIRTFTGVDRIETTALLACMAELAPDELLRARSRRTVAGRAHVLPEWLVGLGEAEVTRCVEMVHVLGDGDDLIIGVDLPGGHSLTISVLVDHNVGTVAKDAFIVQAPIEEIVALLRKSCEAPLDTEWRELDPADARARITEAVDHGAMMFPPFEGDTWPTCRPLVEWSARLLPEGGTGYERPVWDNDARAALTDSFFDSDVGMSLDDREHRDLFESILCFATDYGPGDPLRWSPTAVEILMEDWIPRKVVAPVTLLSMAPDLLRAFIMYASVERGIRPELIADTLAAVDRWEPSYKRAIRSPRLQGPAALFAAMGAFGPDGPWELSGLEDFVVPYDPAEMVLEYLRRAVGGDDALSVLSDEALPDEALDWNGIPEDIRAKVNDVLELCDRCCDELLDVEYRTACRRYLARVAAGDAGVFRRKGRADTAAAAVCWTVGKANDLFTPSGGSVRVKDLLAQFGLTQGSVSQRSATLMKAAGIELDQYYATSEIALGAPELLVAPHRIRLIELRERFVETP